MDNNSVVNVCGGVELEKGIEGINDDKKIKLNN